MNALDKLRAAMEEVDAYYQSRGIFQGTFGFGRRPALVVIDMAYGWTDPAYAGGSARLDRAVDAIRKLLPAARAKKVPVVYTTAASSEPAFKSASDFSPKYRRWDPHACGIDERLEREPAEYVIAKEYAS